jgi:hypothetical protein
MTNEGDQVRDILDTYIFTNSSREALPANQDRDVDALVNGLTGGGRGSQHTSEGLLGMYAYSGADIKLVVHLPPDANGESNSTQLREAQEQLTVAQRALERAQATDSTPLRTTLEGLSADAEARRVIIQGMDPSDPTLATEEAELEAVEARYRDIRAQYQAAQRDEQSRAELEAEVNTLSASVQALQEDGHANALSSRTKVLAEISTLSVSIFREKSPVRPLGTTYVRSYCRGPRTISGSMVVAVFDKHMFHEFFETASYRSTGVGDWDRFTYSSFITDQLPPLDISVCFANEYGNFSWMGLLGVEFVSEGMTMSIEDLFVEGVHQWVARDIDLLRNVGRRGYRPNVGVGQNLTGTSILREAFAQRFIGRNNPFI